MSSSVTGAGSGPGLLAGAPASAVITGAAGLSSEGLGELVVWVCQCVHVPPPPGNVAMLLGVVIISAGHAMYNFVNARWPARQPPAQDHTNS